MKNFKTKKQQGYTLIELLVAITIFATFLAIGGSSLVDVLNLEQKANVLRKTQQDTRYILESIVREARNANGEFVKNGVLKQRVTSAYQFDGSGKFYLVNTNLETGEIVEKIFYQEGDLIKMDVLTKTMGETNFSPKESGVALNKPESLRVIKLDFNGSVIYNNPSDTELQLPPFLHVNIESESGAGLDSDKAELRAHVNLVSSATPRSY